MKTLFTEAERQALDEARKVRASKLRYIHFTDAEGALGMVKEKRIWQSDFAAPAVYAVAVGGTFVPGVQQTRHGRASKRDVAILFTTDEFPDVLNPEEVLWHKDAIRVKSAKIIPVWKARKMLDGSMVKDDTLTGVPAHPSTFDWDKGRVRSGESVPVARVESQEYGLTARTVSPISYDDDDGRRDGVILITAAKGHARSARGIIGKVLKRVLKVRRWHEPPHYISHTGAKFMSQDAGYPVDARYHLTVTDEEMKKVIDALVKAFHADGWDRAPIDVYHD